MFSRRFVNFAVSIVASSTVYALFIKPYPNSVFAAVLMGVIMYAMFAAGEYTGEHSMKEKALIVMGNILNDLAKQVKERHGIEIEFK